MAGGFLVYSASIADDRAPVARRSEPEPPSALPAWSREEFRVSAQIATEASRVGTEVLSLPFSHEEVLPFTSPYLEETVGAPGQAVEGAPRCPRLRGSPVQRGRAGGGGGGGVGGGVFFTVFLSTAAVWCVPYFGTVVGLFNKLQTQKQT